MNTSCGCAALRVQFCRPSSIIHSLPCGCRGPLRHITSSHLFQGSKRWVVMHMGEGVCVHLDHVRKAFADYGNYHAVAARLAQLEKRGGDTATAKKMEQTAKAVCTRFLRRILWVGQSHRTVNALKKGKCRPFFHRSRCAIATG